VLPPPAGYVVGVGFAFDPPVAVGAYAAGFDWGFNAWAPAWGVGTVNYGGNTYISNSVTVVNHGHFGYHDRGVYARGGRGVPRGFHGCARYGAAREAGLHAGYDHRRLDAGRHEPGRLDHNRPGERHQGGSAGHHEPVSKPAGYHGPTGKPAPGRPTTGKPASGHGTTSGKPSSSGHPAPSTNHGGNGNSHSTPGSSHGTTTTKKTATPNRTTSASNRTSSGNRTAASGHGATPAANHTNASAGHAAPSVNHTAANVSHGSAPAAHASGGGHASSPSRGRGK
jgi:hypothetical protein